MPINALNALHLSVCPFAENRNISLYHFLCFPGHVETLIFDVVKHEWSVAVASPPSSVTTSKVQFVGFGAC